MAVHTGRDSGDRVWSDHRLLSHGLAKRGELAAERRARLDRRAVEPGKTSEAASSVLHRLAGAGPPRRSAVDVCLLLRADRKLRYCFLAPNHFEAPIRSEQRTSDPARGFALSCRFSGAAVQRLAFRSNRRASMARRPASLTEWSDTFLGCLSWIEPCSLRHAIHYCRRLLFCVSPCILGSSKHLSRRIGCRSIHWFDQLGRKSRRLCRTANHGLPGYAYPFL